MNELIFSHFLIHERNYRFYGYLVVFALMALWEWKAARRDQKIGRIYRWPNNLGIALLNVLVIRILFPSASLGAAYWARGHQFGLFHWVEVPLAFSVVFTVIFLDWVLYYSHRAFHAVPWMWKFHRMHHTDLEVDVTTGTRFHPAEMVILTVVKSVAIILLGAPVFGAFMFEAVLSSVLLFEHSNISLPAPLEKFLRLFIVTPEMHRIHHSVLPDEHNRNFGFNFSWWDRLLGTYRAQPKNSQGQMALGLDIFDDPQFLKADQMLLQPFLDREGRFDFKHFTQVD
jgi:sterol desaturase/sphingolipid hydroxylase (fatty acid hydroxylase superfamily)